MQGFEKPEENFTTIDYIESSVSKTVDNNLMAQTTCIKYSILFNNNLIKILHYSVHNSQSHIYPPSLEIVHEY